MVGRGRIHLMRAHYEAARDAYRPVIALIEKTGEPWLERIVNNHVAMIEMCLGNFATAMASAQRSLELCRRYGDRGREGDALCVAGIILLEVGLYDQRGADVRRRARAALAHRLALEPRRLPDLRRRLRGSPRRQRRSPMLDEALAEARRLGARYLEANALVARAGVHLRAGHAAAAAARCRAGTAVARAATLVGYEIQGLARHALALVRDPAGNRTAEAGALVHRALALLDAPAIPRGLRGGGLRELRRGAREGGSERSRGQRPGARRGRGRAQARRADRPRLARGLRGTSRVQGTARLS